MNFDLSDDQKQLRDQARRYLADHINYDNMRALITQNASIDTALWQGIAELGWSAVAVPEAYGGLGLGTLDQCVIVEELGRSVAPVPFVSSLGLAAEAILRAGTEVQQERLLPGLASGEVIASFAFFEGAGAPDAATKAGFAVHELGGRLTGRKWPVLDAGLAQFFVVAAKAPDGSKGLYLVKADASGVTQTRMEGFDQLRHGWVLDFDNAPCERLGDADAAVAIAGVFDLAAVLTAFEQIGGAEACLEMARNYALERRAFGRQIGSFQAIKHKLADMVTRIELARSNAYYAGWAFAHDAPDKSLAAATARLSATDAYEFAARENNQVHGGISFTWEANCHFHYRRSRLLAVNLGASRFWSNRIITKLLEKQKG